MSSPSTSLPVVVGPWQLGRAERITAYFTNGHLMVMASGSRPACTRVELDLAGASFPVLTSLILRWRSEHPANAMCPDIMQPYKVTYVACLTIPPKEVAVTTADGGQRIPVEPLAPVSLDGLPGSAAAADKLILDNPAWRDALAKQPAVRRATGNSETFDFGEAFQDAIGKLPPGPMKNPDVPTVIRVTGIRALSGGFVAQRGMFVDVEALD